MPEIPKEMFTEAIHKVLLSDTTPLCVPPSTMTVASVFHPVSTISRAFHCGFLQAVSDNLDYVPPYGAGGSLYIRPFLFGSGAKLGLGPSPEYTFGVMVNPVGAYYKGGLTGDEG